MKDYQALMKEARISFRNADHMIYVTYPLIKDPKLITTIIDNLYYSILKSIEALLRYDYYNKNIDGVPEEWREKIRMFKEHAMKKYGFSDAIIEIFNELHKFMEFRKKSATEFIRKDNLVICDMLYSTKMINFKQIKEYAGRIKPFIQKAEGILG